MSTLLETHPQVEGPFGSDDGRHTHAPQSAAARVLTSLIRTYQSCRSGRPTGCRYLPTCSEYAVGAIDRHGPVSGSFLAVRRLARCGPWGGHGVDPVPERSVK